MNRKLSHKEMPEDKQVARDEILGNLYTAAQAGDVQAAKTYLEITQDDVQQDIPPELVTEAIASVKGMAGEYVAAMPECCKAAIMKFVDMICEAKQG